MSARPPREPGTDERPLDDVAPPDPLSFDDPEAQAREERRLERERRRREREQRRLGIRRPPGDGQPAAEQQTAVRPTRVQRARAGMAAARRRLPSRPPSTAIRRRRTAAVVVLAVAALALWFALALFQPFGGDGDGKVVVTIPKGATASEVGDILERKGVISDGPPLVSGSTLFRMRLSMAGKTDQIPEGTYTLASGMSYGAAIDELTASPAERGVTVVIPEGYTRDQIAKVASDAGLKGNYKQATVGSKLIDLKQYGAGGAKSLEGFLFPATYELHSNVDELVSQQLKAFRQNFDKLDLSSAKSKNLTPYDVLTIASMIEREVQVPSERRLVAAVIYNRLAAGEPLAIDATIRYATGNYDKPLTESELSIDSPYNTRLVAGLPPTPIGNPGLAAMKAAADPAKSDARFYVIKPGTCGEHVFTDSEAEFNEAAAEYQRALKEQGGSPTEC